MEDQGAYNSCGGTWGGGNKQVSWFNWDLVGGCGDAHGITVRHYSSELVDLIAYAKNDGDDWAVGIGGGGWRSNGGGYGGYDIAEMYMTSDSNWNPGDLMVIDPQNAEELLVSGGKAYDNMVLGVITTRPGIYMLEGWTVTGAAVDLDREQLMYDAPHYLDIMAGYWEPADVERARPFFDRMAKGEVAPVALAGRVPVNVTGENGPIRPGDLVTTSSTRGHGMRATQGGATVGVALTGFDGTSSNDRGQVTVFISRQDSSPVVADPNAGVASHLGGSSTSIASMQSYITTLETQLQAQTTRVNDLEAQIAEIRRMLGTQPTLNTATVLQPTVTGTLNGAAQ
jgi:hypothetical protein